MNNRIRPVKIFGAPHIQVFDDAGLTGRRDATEILSERFTILKAVGVDHHLIRLLAREPGQDELFLLEVLVDSAACDPELTELFYLEAEAAARLDHPNIPAAHPAERLDNIHYRVVAHHPHSETLRDLLDRAGWLSAARVAEIAAQLAQALAHAHERGVLHLRLQAEDVLLDRENNALLGNFGIADLPELKWAHRHRLCQLRLSSLCPEAPDADEARAADWYALGALCYEMLTDRVPFDSEEAEYLRRKQSLSRPLYPHIITPGIPEGLARLVIGLLDKEADERLKAAAGFQLRIMQSLSVPAPARARDPETVSSASAPQPRLRREAAPVQPKPAPPRVKETESESVRAPVEETPVVQRTDPAPFVGAKSEPEPISLGQALRERVPELLMLVATGIVVLLLIALPRSGDLFRQIRDALYEWLMKLNG